VNPLISSEDLRGVFKITTMVDLKNGSEDAQIAL